jgi:crotonobetainyl-CoA:carnitine CoA-transferase CaiB-like acyl-CoA transferase
VEDDAGWEALATIIGAPQLGPDPRFATETARHRNRAELDAILAQWTAAHPAAEIEAALQRAGIAAHASWNAADIVADPHLRSRRAIVDVREPDGRERAAVGVPVRLSKGADIGIARGTPKLGEHEDYVYGELLRMTNSDRAALQDEQVIY